MGQHATTPAPRQRLGDDLLAWVGTDALEQPFCVKVHLGRENVTTGRRSSGGKRQRRPLLSEVE